MNRYDFIESLALIKDVNMFKKSVKGLVSELCKEGFEMEEIYDFMKYMIVNECDNG